MALADPLSRLVEDAYDAFARPAPKHLPGCCCALCRGGDEARGLAGRPAREWTAEAVSGWFARVGQEARHRSGVQVVSRTDRAVFRFLLPKVLEMLADGALPRSGDTFRVFAEFAPGRTAGLSPEEGAVLRRFGAQFLDRALADPASDLNVIEALQVLVIGGWPLVPLLRQAMRDPDLPAALARAWGTGGVSDPLFAGQWPSGAAELMRAHLGTSLVSERLMNFAMAQGTTVPETDAATRAADRILRSR
jgi:hypothetical protein